jgi:hypothetical protein
MRVFLRLCKQGTLLSTLRVWFGVRALPEPEPDLLEPEPMVWFRVRGNTPNRTDSPVSGSGKTGKEPD